MPYHYGSSAASSSSAPAIPRQHPALRAPTLSIVPLEAENATDVISVPPINDMEPLSVYPGRRHFFHVDCAALLDAFLARNTPDFEVFREEFHAMKFSYIVEMHPKEVPQDVISLLADTIYDLARVAKYRLGCVYLIYLLYYCQDAPNRHSFSISLNDLRMLENIVRELSPSNATVGHLLAKMVADDAFMVSFQKCPTSTYFSGSGFYRRLSRDHAFAEVANACTERKKCQGESHRLLAHDGSTIIDFEALALRVATLPGANDQLFQRTRARFDDYTKHQKPERPSRRVFMPPSLPGPRMKKRETPVARANSERLGVRAALARVKGVSIDDIDFSEVIPDNIVGVPCALRKKRKRLQSKDESALLALTDGTTLPQDPSTPNSTKKNNRVKSSTTSSSLSGYEARDGGLQHTVRKENSGQHESTNANAGTTHDDSLNSSPVGQRPPKRRKKNQGPIADADVALPKGTLVSTVFMKQAPMGEKSSSQDQIKNTPAVSVRRGRECSGPGQQGTPEGKKSRKVDANAAPLDDASDYSTSPIIKTLKKTGTFPQKFVDAKATNGTRIAMKTRKVTKAKANEIIDANAPADDASENCVVQEEKTQKQIMDANVDLARDTPEESTREYGGKRKRCEIVNANADLADGHLKKARLMAKRIPMTANTKQSNVNAKQKKVNAKRREIASTNGSKKNRLIAKKVPMERDTKQSQGVPNTALTDDAPEDGHRIAMKAQRQVKTQMRETNHANADVASDAPERGGIVDVHSATADTASDASVRGHNDVSIHAGSVARTPPQGQHAKPNETVELASNIPRCSNPRKQTMSSKRRGTREAVGESVQNTSVTCRASTSSTLRSVFSRKQIRRARRKLVEASTCSECHSSISKQNMKKTIAKKGTCAPQRDSASVRNAVLTTKIVKKTGTLASKMSDAAAPIVGRQTKVKKQLPQSPSRAETQCRKSGIVPARTRSRARNVAQVVTFDAAGEQDDPPQILPDKSADAKLGKSQTRRNARLSSRNGPKLRPAVAEETHVSSRNNGLAHKKATDFRVPYKKSVGNAWANITPPNAASVKKKETQP